MRELGTRVEEFLEALPAESGFVFGARERMTVNELVLALFERGELPEDEREWEGLLAPVVCGTQEQQREFRAAFRAKFGSERLGQDGGGAGGGGAGGRKWWRWAAALVGLGLVAGGGWLYWLWKSWEPQPLNASAAVSGVTAPSRIYAPPWFAWTKTYSVVASGTVVSLTGRPVANADVYVPGAAVKTDAVGNFAASVRPSGGTVPLLVAHPDFASDLQELFLTAGQVVRGVRLEPLDSGPRLALEAAKLVKEVVGPAAGTPLDSRISIDGSRVASGSGSVTFWDPQTGLGLGGLSTPFALGSLRRSPIFSPSTPTPRQPKFWYLGPTEIADLDLLGRFHTPALSLSHVLNASFSHDEKSVAVLSFENQLSVVSVYGVDGKRRWDTSKVGEIGQAVTFFHDNKRVLVVERDGTVATHDPGALKIPPSRRLPVVPTDIQLSSDDRMIVASLSDHETAFYELATLREVGRINRGGAIQILPSNGNLLIAEAEARVDTSMRKWRWLALLVPLLTIGAWLWWLYWKRARLKRFSLPLELDAHALKAPEAEPIFRGPLIRKLGLALRRRKPAGRGPLDEPATIHTSLKQGGFLAPVYGTQTQQREHLWLIQMTTAADQRALLDLALARQLKQQDVLLEVFVFRDLGGEAYRWQLDPARGISRRDANFKKGLPLRELAAVFPAHDLWLFADPASLVEPFTGKVLVEWDVMAQWADRAVLSPVPVERGVRALWEGEGFRVAVATPEGLASVSGESGDSGEAEASRKLKLAPPGTGYPLADEWLDRRIPEPHRIASLIDDLRAFLGPEGMRLVSACAIYPELSSPLTWWLSAKLCDAGTREATLGRVTSLPWFRHGWMPNWLRTALAKRLRGEMERDVRAAIEEFLLLVTGPGADFRVGGSGKKKPQGGRPLKDYVLLTFLTGGQPDDEPSVSVGSWLKRMLFLGGHLVMGTRKLGHALVVAGSLLLGLGAWFGLGEMITRLGSRPVVSEWTLPKLRQEPIPHAWPNEALPRLLLALAESQEGGAGVRAGVPSRAIRPASFVSDVAAYAGRLEGHQLLGETVNAPGPGVAFADGFIESVSGGQAVVIQARQGAVERVRAAVPKGPYTAFRVTAAPPVVGPADLEVATNPKDGLRYVRIPAGPFRMGCSPSDTECYADEKPAHDVQITKSFWMGQRPVTAGAYKRFVGSVGKAMPAEPVYLGKNLNPGWKDESLPMTMVSWDDARGYCEWAGMRLPTEAEWEYAARAGSTGARYGVLDEIAWYAKRIIENGNRPHPVGKKKANAFQLFDMLGNVWQWTSDWFDDGYYKASHGADPRGPSSGSQRVLRGGSWGVSPRIVRASCRGLDGPAVRSDNVGFRCVGEKLVP